MATRGSNRKFLSKFSAALVRFIQKIPWLLPTFFFLSIGFAIFYSWQASQKCASEVEVSIQVSLIHGLKLSSKTVFRGSDGKQACSR